MSDRVTNESAAAEQSQVRLQEMAPPSSISSSDKLLSRIAILLFILVVGVLTVFGYYASSICITVVLAGFLAILFDPLVVKLERLHMPRSVAAAGIVLAGIGLIALLGYVLYGRAMSFAEELPVYASRIQQGLCVRSRDACMWRVALQYLTEHLRLFIAMLLVVTDTQWTASTA
jgi:predicted PurR-regulated permease PerM